MHAWEDRVGFQWEVTNNWSQTEEVGGAFQAVLVGARCEKSLEAHFRTQSLGVRPRNEP